MAKVSKKSLLTTVDGTPKKRLFLSIISDYDLKTGVCELVDNALDLWVGQGRKANLTIDVTLDADRQLIKVRDNAGGIDANQAELLIAPGASRNDVGEALIGIFGVGGKRAGIALGELIEIQTRSHKGTSIQVDLTKDWIESPNWDLDVFEIPEIDPGTTDVEISKVRQSFDDDDIQDLRHHLAETYGWFIEQGCRLTVNRVPLDPISFATWSFPRDYPPRTCEFDIEPEVGQKLNVRLTAGLIGDRDPEADNYGAYFICNHRLIMKEVKQREVGYFVSAEAGVPHPDASLGRTIVEYVGPAELMPWNSSKSGINFNHPAFLQIRSRVIEFASFYSKLSRALKRSWEDEVFPFRDGKIVEVDPLEVLSDKKKVLPKPPSTRNPKYADELRLMNNKVIDDKPWTLGLVEAMSMVELIGRQKFETKNRAALILLDSNFEISLKEFIVSSKKLFPPHKYTNKHISNLFSNRSNVINEVQNHAKFPQKLLDKVNYYYAIRNNLIHQRATVAITDQQVKDYRQTIERVLNKLFKIRFPN